MAGAQTGEFSSDIMDGSLSDFSPEVVGNAFVTQYYKMLHTAPEHVHKYYQDSSTMSRPGPDGKPMTVTGMNGVNELIISSDCKDYRIQILDADSQASHRDGVIVLVTGFLTGKDNVRRKFAETFFLAPQDKGYFVLNDVFRFVGDNIPPVVVSVEEKVYDKIAPAAPTTSVEETIEVPNGNSFQSHTEAAEIPTENNIEASEVSKAEQKSTANESVSTNSSPSIQPVTAVVSNGHVDVPKKSYASLLKNVEGKTGTLVRAPTSAAKKAATTNGAQKSGSSPAAQQSRAAAAPASAAPASASEVSVPNGSHSRSSSTDGAEGHSIFIGGLPYNATVQQVEEEFKKFGRIKQNGIQVRQNQEYCFGFVEYEDVSGKEKAIKTRKLLVGGKEAYIEEKKSSTRVVNGASRYPSGRGGGYRNDGFRGNGQGNYPNRRDGYVKNDYGNKRNGEAPPSAIRGNGNGRSNGDNGYHNGYRNGGAPRGGVRQEGARPPSGAPRGGVRQEGARPPSKK